MNVINTKNNKLIKNLINLLNEKKHRDSSNNFVAETYKVVNTLIDNNIKCRNIIISTNSKYRNSIKFFTDKNIMVDVVNHSIFDSISTLKNSDGVLAVFYKPNSRFSLQPNKKYVICDKIQNPGNLGTIIRTACAFEFDGIIINNDSVDFFHPTVIRSSMGMSCILPFNISTSLADVVEKCKTNKITTYATFLSPKSENINSISFSKSCAIILGNEGNGLDYKVIKNCDHLIQIPISKNIDSLNVSISFGIIASKLI
jgi:TrmH family RNA methyltransferase